MNASTQEYVPYANVYLKSFRGGTTSFNNGKFSLKLDLVFEDTLVVSCMGFKTARFYLPDLFTSEPVTLQLFPDTNLLKEVPVKAGKVDMETLGLYRKKPEYCAGILAQMPRARYIPNARKRKGFVRSIAVYVGKKGVYNAPFRINLLRINADSSNTPGEGLIKEDYILSSKEGGEWVSLDLLEKYISIPENGFFVVVQPLPLDTSKRAYYEARYKLSYPSQFYTAAPQFGYVLENVAEGYDKSWGFAKSMLKSSGETRKGWYRVYADVFDNCKTEKERLRTSIGNVMVKVEVAFYEE